MGKRSNCLRTPEDFSRGLKTRPVASGGPFSVHVVRTTEGHRLGFILPKRFARQAVWRNKIKRWTREAFRLHICPSWPSCDVIVRLRQPLSVRGKPVPCAITTRNQLLAILNTPIPPTLR
jgi:ribonuclease P protein component